MRQAGSDNSLGDWPRTEVSSQSESRTVVTRPGCLDTGAGGGARGGGRGYGGS